MRTKGWKRLYVWAVLVLAVAELLLMLASWLLSATMLGGMRSLLSSEGLRWYAGQYTGGGLPGS